MSHFIIELGVDRFSRVLFSRDDRYLPAGLVQVESGVKSLSTYFHLKRGDTIGVEIFDISALSLGGSPDMKVESLTLSFESARTGQEQMTPLNDVVLDPIFSELISKPSLVFQGTFPSISAFADNNLITIKNKGFYVSQYVLSAKFGDDPSNLPRVRHRWGAYLWSEEGRWLRRQVPRSIVVNRVSSPRPH